MARLYQGNSFVFSEASGALIERLVGIVDSERPATDNEPIVVYLKTIGYGWHRFFLDGEIGVLEDCGMSGIDESEEGDQVRLVDYSELFNIRGRRIWSMCCVDARFQIALQGSGIFVLEQHGSSEDATCKATFVP